jgi:hypothetical protein
MKPKAGQAPAVTARLAPGPSYHLLVLAAFVAVFALIPLSIYMHSGEDWGFPPHLLLRIAAMGFGLWAVAAIAIRVLAMLHGRAAVMATAAIFCIGAFLLLAHVYTPIAIGPLDGEELWSREPLLHTVVEGLLLIVLLFAFVSLIRNRGLAAARLFSLLLVAVTGGYAVASVVMRPPEVTPIIPESRAASDASTSGNVYHFVLDTMQTEAFLDLIERHPHLVEAFAGFTLFRNNVANYLATRQSSASYFTSTFYDEDGWQKSWKRRGLLPSLVEAGYTIWMYAPFADWRNQFTHHFWYTVDLYEHEARLSGTDFSDFLHIWLVGLAPNPLTNEAVPVAGALRDRLFRLLTGRAPPLAIEQGKFPYSGVLTLRHLLSGEAERPADGQYVYVHPPLPHAPHVLDRECRYVGRRTSAAERPNPYLEQSLCTIGLVADFLAHLRELDRYDRATIIVQADTGPNARRLEEAKELIRTGGELADDHRIALLTKVSALLMIKPAGARGGLEQVTQPSQLVDLLPTLVDLLDLRPPDYPTVGAALFAPDPMPPREARFGLRSGPDMIEVRIDRPGELARSPLTVLGPYRPGQRAQMSE